ncbi:hypothetical protein IGS68_21725 [Skermanella sp. TT6]|uniref:Uncharacterized protein n=1 Tax=Skermanella cutis TaxID=2775420 RepID=A0ABX7B363_9PROT|nr:hypothetical protein [Skermanella sp. TT6]QQP88617.1 hypothetical protein IGS68_21725 [Skermanella sp. TT6]
MATIDRRSGYSRRARVRRNGKSEARAFVSYEAAQRWVLELERKIVGDYYEDRRQAHGITFAQVLDWLITNINR